ncbi:chromosome segregation protein [Kutzneria sp. NPDC052558]|uniref:chromosome segregation protein n=1 Tax=Kutzneria sp. NPDC052558 TaxID=3364121 RepID=UPI0037CC2392
MAPAENRDITQSIPSFTVAMRGYDRMEVETHLKRITSEVRLFAADRDAALRQADELAKQLDQARARIEELKGHLEQARQAPPPAAPEPVEQDTPDQAKRKLQLAEATAAETHARAEAAAETTWAHAESAATKLRERYQTLLSDLDKQQAEIIAEHQSLMEKARSEAAELTTVAVQRRKELDEQAEARRRQIEADFAQEMADKRKAALDALAAEEAARKAELDQRVTAAIADAEARINRSNQEAARLRDYRERIADQLRSATGLLNDAGSLLEPLKEEFPQS